MTALPKEFLSIWRILLSASNATTTKTTLMVSLLAVPSIEAIYLVQIAQLGGIATSSDLLISAVYLAVIGLAMSTLAAMFVHDRAIRFSTIALLNRPISLLYWSGRIAVATVGASIVGMVIYAIITTASLVGIITTPPPTVIQTVSFAATIFVVALGVSIFTTALMVANLFLGDPFRLPNMVGYVIPIVFPLLLPLESYPPGIKQISYLVPTTLIYSAGASDLSLLTIGLVECGKYVAWLALAMVVHRIYLRRLRAGEIEEFAY